MTDKTDNTTEALNDLLLTTPDIQAERLAELKRLFPDMFDGEGRLKLDDIKQLVGDDPQCRERYDFSWYGKRNAKAKAYTPTTATLSYDEKRSVNPEKADGNIIIEGENLESLKTLLSAYRESIKCIYIDPPYNTGKDFVYSDNYTEDKRAYWEDTGSLEDGVKVDSNPETAGRYHSNWLSMMYSRLLLARNLLKDDGVIFVSIDDNEVHNLRRMMDEVFGEENFIASIVWQKRTSPDARLIISSGHETILIFAKNIEQGKNSLKRLPLTDEQKKAYRNPDNDPRGAWVSSDFTAQVGHATPQQFYTIVAPNGKKHKPPQGTCWKNIEPVFKKKMKEGRFWFGKEGNGFPRRKTYLAESEGRSVWSWWTNKEVGHTQEASKELKEIMQFTNVFDNPKPTKLIRRMMQFITDKDSLVMDFFSGSGSTSQAILELNQDDEGRRKFILVQLPEQTPEKSEARKAGYKKISDITIERVKRVIEGYGDNPKPIDTGFKVYKLTKSHFPRTDFKPDPEKSEAENIEALKQYIAEKEKQLIGLFEATEIQDEVLLKNGFKLNYQLTEAKEFTTNKVKLADDGEKQSLLCLDTELHPETVKYLLESPQNFICLETSLSTSDKWNLRQHLKHQFVAF